MALIPAQGMGYVFTPDGGIGGLLNGTIGIAGGGLGGNFRDHAVGVAPARPEAVRASPLGGRLL